MWPGMMRRLRVHWAVTILLPGVILVVAGGLHWSHGPVLSASAMRRGATGVCREHIRNMDRALGQGAVSAAEINWLVARLEAMRCHTWEAWIGVGDAALRLGEATGSRTAYLPRARYAFRKALLTAQEAESQAGVLAAAEGFAALGDQVLADDLRVLARTLPPSATDLALGSS
jgi:hypothetical protein